MSQTKLIKPLYLYENWNNYICTHGLLLVAHLTLMSSTFHLATKSLLLWGRVVLERCYTSYRKPFFYAPSFHMFHSTRMFSTGKVPIGLQLQFWPRNRTKAKFILGPRSRAISPLALNGQQEGNRTFPKLETMKN